MYRVAFSYLESWKSRRTRKPLIIRGARQVGKTTLARLLSKNINMSVTYFDLENPEDQTRLSDPILTLRELKGLVINDTDGLALPGVDVLVVGTNLRTLTIEDGTYVIKNIPEGTYKIEFHLQYFLKKTIKTYRLLPGRAQS